MTQLISTTCGAKMRTLLLPILVLSCLSIFHSSAQNVPVPGGGRGITTQAASRSDIQGYLELQNKERAEVGVAPLTWSDTVAKSASLALRPRRHNCKIVNVTNSKYGSNQLYSSGYTMTPRKAMELLHDEWVNEKQIYNHSTNACAENRHCDTYTQVVWRKSLELGCAQVKCVKKQALTLCFYNPPGNVVGESPY